MLARPPLTSSCAAHFLLGQALVRVRSQRVGDPCFIASGGSSQLPQSPWTSKHLKEGNKALGVPKAEQEKCPDRGEEENKIASQF